MRSFVVNDRMLAVVFVTLASLAAIHLLGKRFERSADRPLRGPRPEMTQPAEPLRSQDPPAP